MKTESLPEESEKLIDNLVEIPEVKEGLEQIRSEETVSKSMTPTIENHPVCAECRGWCCYRFEMTVYPTEDGFPDWDRAYENGLLNKHDVEFIKNNFTVKPLCPNLGIQNVPEGFQKFTLSCKAYDLNEGCCTDYENRPQCCKTYKCDVEIGKDPNKAGDNNRIQKNCMKRRGIEI